MKTITRFFGNAGAAVLLAVASTTLASDGADVLAGTEPLIAERPVDQRMIEGLKRFCLKELAAAPTRRSELWRAPMVTREDLDMHVASRRERLRAIVGAVDVRLTNDAKAPADFELVATLNRTSVVAQNRFVTVHQVRWPVLEGVTAEGLLMVPEVIHAAVIALPDADCTPEVLCGVHKPGSKVSDWVGRLAEAGCLVVVPMLISRNDEFSGHRDVTFTNQPHREFVYRQAYEVGRHVIGYEVQKTLAAVDLLERRVPRSSAVTSSESATGSPSVPIGVVGMGEGGLIALHAAALDPRIKACWVSGHFDRREDVWQEPIYRNVWTLLQEFGDAELAGMIAPRRIVIEAAHVVNVPGPPTARAGRASVAAPGRIAPRNLDSVKAEFARAERFFAVHERENQLTLAVSGDDGAGKPGCATALREFAKELNVLAHVPDAATDWSLESLTLGDRDVANETARKREERQLNELQSHVQTLLLRSHQVRDARWRLDPKAIADWREKQPQLRKWVHDDLIGRLPHARLPLRPRSRRVRETEDYVGYEIEIDVFDDVLAAGLLLIPKGIKVSEKRPVVVCQHGLEGTPWDVISRDPKPFATYKAFGEELVKRGFVVYAPQNPYRGGDRFRELQRMSNPLGRTLFSYIVAQHEQTLDWLATLPFVDPNHIGFYGISYGGKTAMRVPPLVPRYQLAICSGDFTDWPRTLAANNERFSYLFTSEYEVFEWNLAHVASYAELACLMSPRPFMVEEGHRDGGQPSEWVAGEFGKVRRHYDQLGIGDRAELEFFDGPHTIHGVGTHKFLRRFLRD